MVCVACLLPLFLIPIVNLLPVLFYMIMGKIYGLFGWEYRKPVITPPACPYKPKNQTKVEADQEPKSAEPDAKAIATGVDKLG